MAAPDFQSLMLPLLKIAGDGNEHTHGRLADPIAVEHGPSEQDKDYVTRTTSKKSKDQRISDTGISISYSAIANVWTSVRPVVL